MKCVFILTNLLCPSLLHCALFRLAAKCARIDNRNLLCLGIIFAIAGSLLFGDWQAVVHSDPCLLSLTSNTTANPQTPSISGGNITDTLCLGDSASNSSLLAELVESCESLSSSVDECFWNRQSRVTGTYCYSCLGVCLSLSRSQNIYQLSMAVILLSISGAFVFLFSLAIVSDITSVKSQVSE